MMHVHWMWYVCYYSAVCKKKNKPLPFISCMFWVVVYGTTGPSFCVFTF